MHTKLTGTAVRSEKYRPRPRCLGGRLGWRGVYDNLVRDGFNVTIVQEPETSFQDDVTAVKRILALPDAGEKESEDGKRFPSDLAKSGAIKKTPDGFTYIDPAQFHE